MITFKQHISISNGFSFSDDGKVLVEEERLLERLNLIREMESVYPLKDSKRITPYIKENFNVGKSVKELVLGQFIMIEQILTGKQKFSSEEEMELAMLQLLLRPKHHKEFDNENHSEELKNREMILNSPVQDVYNVLHRYLDDRERVLFHEFSGVFYERDEDTGEETPKQDEELEEQEVAAQFSQQWYWYSIVRMLAKEDVRVYPEIYMLKMDIVLPEMSYLAQKNKVESAQRRQEAALSKL
jgi:hypothetical protein